MEAENYMNRCRNCGGTRISGWNELSDEQKMLAERLPASAEYTLAERKKHRFCTRCWFEETLPAGHLA
ncbi:MAG: hypothetical protein IT174_17255 [Acidobacteria bacterium]|nr:hypothetical protein [Acidobacteriota bacterium]